ncbi:MAG: S-ribosylhomocysteine lyase [Armatimonadetes bacterium]|nr:S-ribosylhomocysteine lyase [Candidatus Hippobium faecium]
MTFDVDHTRLKQGIYKADITYDLRVVVPYSGCLVSNSAMHSLEHILAWRLNSKINKIYFGPMGCQTGFYLLSDNPEEEVYQAIIEACEEALADKTVPFATMAECGNYYTLQWTQEVENILVLLTDMAKKALAEPGVYVYPIIGEE